MNSVKDVIEGIIPKELALEVYRDFAQPTIQKIGQALAGVASIVTTPIVVGSSVASRNMEIYIKKLEKNDVGNIVSASPEIAIPILQKLRYTSSDELVNLYTELLLKASLKDVQQDAHPSYYEIITNLSVDEARILNYIRENLSIDGSFDFPFLEIRITNIENRHYNLMNPFLCNIPKDVDLIYPKKINSYLQNLIRLGLIEQRSNVHFADLTLYKELQESAEVREYEYLINRSGPENKERVDKIKGIFRITPYGVDFIRLCVPTKEIFQDDNRK